MEAHLSECEFCLERLLKWQRIQLQRFETVGMMQEPYPECPGENEVQEVAAQMATPEATARILQHAAQCDHCGPLLKQYLQAFSEEPLPEIEALLQQLPSSRPGWKKKKAREIARQISGAKSSKQFQEASPAWWFALRPRILTGAVALVSLSVALYAWGPAMLEAWQLKKAKKLVSQAYAKHRVTEMRQTAAVHGVYQDDSGKMGSKDDADDLKHPELNRAWSNLSDRLNSGGKLDPRWLQIQGRLLLLKDPANSKAAEASFREAQAKGLTDPSLEIDLAISYFEQDLASARATSHATQSHGYPNLSRSIDLLKKVLSYPQLTEEQKAVALFNLAVAYEKSNWLDIAVETWHTYLATDPNGPWSDEARARLAVDQKQLHNSLGPAISLEATDFLANLLDPVVRQNVEEYMEVAGTTWLPEAIRNPGSDSYQAYHAQADLLKKNTLMVC
jgi:hypothetical protein